MDKEDFFEISTLDLFPMGLCVFREDFEVIFWNTLLEEWSCIERGEIVGQSLLEYFPHLKKRGYPERIKQVAQGAPTAIFSHKLHRGLIPCPLPDGSNMPQKYSLTKFKKKDDEASYLLLCVEDVTDTEKHLKIYRELKENAESASHSKSNFLATMSHEIRTPMNAVLSCANLLLDNVTRQEDVKLLQTIQNSGDALLTLINDILDFSKIESGKMELEQQPFDLHFCINETLDLLKTKASDKEIKLSAKIDKDVPVWIRGDVTRFRQVLINLVGNGIKFTKSKVLVTVKAEALESNEHEILVSVVDDGIGMPEEAREKLFKSFSQVDASTTRKFGGTGLGLAICKGLTEAMGGEIWVESVKDEGSTFYFTIVAEKTVTGEAKKRQKLSEINPQMGKEHPLKILMAEDNTINQMVARKMLEKLNYRIDIAANGWEAIKALERQNYDLILMDQHMPEMDGVEATKRICGKWDKKKRPRIVALTASAFKEDRDRCFEAGMDDFLTKPIQIHEVVRVLQQCESRYGVFVEKQEVINFEALYNQFSGESEMLAEISENCLREIPKCMKAIERAVLEEDAGAIEREIHTLKGMVANFQADVAVEGALKLELLVRKKEMTQARSAFEDLKRTMEQLQIDLKRLIEKRVA